MRKSSGWSGSGRNAWIKGEDLKAYVGSWAGSQTEEALDWLKDHDSGMLPHTIKEACPNRHDPIAKWIQRQTDPEIKRMCEQALTSWEKEEREKRGR